MPRIPPTHMAALLAQADRIIKEAKSLTAAFGSKMVSRRAADQSVAQPLSHSVHTDQSVPKKVKN